MQTMVPLYGFGGGGGTGATLTVNAPAGCTVTVSKDGKTKTKTAGADGVAVFKGLATGDWTLSITDGEQTAQKTVTITADYTAAITFFAATIHVTYPAGSTCTATDGTTTLTAPDTSGTWEFGVPNLGTWSVNCVNGDYTMREDVEIMQAGQTVNVSPKLYICKNGVYNPGYELTRVNRSTPDRFAITNGDGYIEYSSVNPEVGYGLTTENALDLSRFSRFVCIGYLVNNYNSTGGICNIAIVKDSTGSIAWTDSVNSQIASASFPSESKEFYIPLSAELKKQTLYVGLFQSGKIISRIQSMWLE